MHVLEQTEIKLRRKMLAKTSQHSCQNYSLTSNQKIHVKLLEPWTQRENKRGLTSMSPWGEPPVNGTEGIWAPPSPLATASAIRAPSTRRPAHSRSELISPCSLSISGSSNCNQVNTKLLNNLLYNKSQPENMIKILGRNLKNFMTILEKSTVNTGFDVNIS